MAFGDVAFEVALLSQLCVHSDVKPNVIGAIEPMNGKKSFRII